MTLNLLDYDAAGLAELLASWGDKPFRAGQLARWIHQRGEGDFARMSDLAKSLRVRLQSDAAVEIPRVISDTSTADGTRKWLLDVGAGNAIESVLIPDEHRETLCVSSQAGCALDCAFCSTGRQGFNRNLRTGEIIAQLWWANRCLAADAREAPNGRPRRVSNVVFMGMGEPLANFDAMLPALRLMLDDMAYGLSRRRVTVSTSGIVPAIDRLRESCPVALAVSLHAPNDALRDRLVPINRKWPIDELLAACVRYLTRSPRDFVMFEYVMLKGVNDGELHARELIARLREVPCKVNLIPFNPFPCSGFERSPPETIQRFRDTLLRAGIVTTIRRTRGEEIDAACGQLAGRVRPRSGGAASRSTEVVL